MDIQRWVEELRRRRVFRALVGYGIAALIVLRASDALLQAAHLPGWILSVEVVALGLGFPITVALAWVFDLTSGGVQRTPPGASSGGGVPVRGARVVLAVLGLGLLAAAPGLVYHFVLRAGPRPEEASATSGASVPEVPSIAVLPLVNLSSDKEQEYFSDGLTEELLDLLAKVPGLRVAARTSAFAFKGKNVKMSVIGRELGVATVLEGSVRRSGERVRVTTQLINASDGYHLWSETYDRRITDVFALQDEIATAVVGALKLKLLRAPVGKHRTESVEAHDLYLRGLSFWNLRTPDSLLRAAEFFRKAIQADPGYALAYAGLADALEVRRGYVWARTNPEQVTQARDAALKALELDPELGEAHASLGLMRMDEFDMPGGLEHYRKAVALRPGYATAHHWYAVALATLGRFTEARQEIQEALRLDPVSRVINLNAGWVEEMARDYDRAASLYEGARDLAPDFETARSSLAMLYALQGRRDEALAELQKVSPDGENRSAYAVVYAKLGRRREAEQVARALEDLSRREYVPPSILAAAWSALDDRDRAFAALRRACRERDGSWNIPLKVDWVYDGLRSDPRYGEMLECLRMR